VAVYEASYVVLPFRNEPPLSIKKRLTSHVRRCPMRKNFPVLEVRGRRGGLILRAEGPLAICAVVSMRLMRWIGIVVLAGLGGPILP
jgi:hypothetical protein